MSRARDALSLALRGAALLLALALLLLGAGWWAYTHRPRPEPVARELWPGLRYERRLLSQPRPLIVHVLRVKRRTPGLRLLVTPGVRGEPRPYRARTTSAFLEEFHQRAAINGDAFFPWESVTPFYYRPRAGEPAGVYGEAVSAGKTISRGRRGSCAGPCPTFYVAQDGALSIGHRPASVQQAVSGISLLLHAGQPVAPRHRDLALHPRSALALSPDELLLVVVDGRQPNYSEGVTERELGQLLRGMGATEALNLDGGGSSALVVEDPEGRARTLNSPIHTRIPGRHRPVANHLGIWVPGAP